MRNELTSKTKEVTTEIIDNATNFKDFLSSDEVKPIRKSLKIIPNVIDDIINVILENKRLNIENKQFIRKAEMLDKYLDLKDKDLQRQYYYELEKIHIEAETEIMKENNRYDVQLEEIKSYEKMQLKQIESDEKKRIAELRIQYDLVRQEQERKREQFNRILDESNRRFDRKMIQAKQVQKELTKILRILTTKLIKGTANDLDCKLISQLSEMKVKVLDDTFNIVEEFVNIFMEDK